MRKHSASPRFSGTDVLERWRCIPVPRGHLGFFKASFDSTMDQAVVIDLDGLICVWKSYFVTTGTSPLFAKPEMGSVRFRVQKIR